MIFRLLANTVVVLHLAFVAFAVFGGFAAWRWRRVVFLHLPALAWGCWIELSHRICPLTPLENMLRHKAGDAGYSGGFVEHYILPVLYPASLTDTVQLWLAGILVTINLVAYAGLLLLTRFQQHRSGAPG
jgi:hypothetical protein